MTRAEEEGHSHSRNMRAKVLALLTRVTRLRGLVLYLLILTVGSAISIGVDLSSGHYSWSMLANLAIGITVWALAWPGVVRAWQRTDRTFGSSSPE
ncbi:hypothetical protein ACFXHA_41010 [Nocardia sp. NPDC059240]|uniref:hypothetical protein n=1 Tax=Nocardia sp. NPDC059240 TaxID=3346786 RepID=UPI0036C3D2CE